MEEEAQQHQQQEREELPAEPLQPEDYAGYLRAAQAQEQARYMAATMAPQNGHAAEPDAPPPPAPAPDPRQRPQEAPHAPAGVNPYQQAGQRIAGPLRPQRQPAPGELVEWGRGAALGAAVGVVAGVAIAYILVSRMDSKEEE